MANTLHSPVWLFASVRVALLKKCQIDLWNW